MLATIIDYVLATAAIAAFFGSHILIGRYGVWLLVDLLARII